MENAGSGGRHPAGFPARGFGCRRRFLAPGVLVRSDLETGGQPRRRQTEGIGGVGAGFGGGRVPARAPDHARLAHLRRELGGVVGVGGEPVGADDPPVAVPPLDGGLAAAGADPNRPDSRGIEAEDPFVGEVPGALVEVLLRPVGDDDHRVAPPEVAVSGGRRLGAETRFDGVRVRAAGVSPLHAHREIRFREPEGVEVEGGGPGQPPLEPEGLDVLQQEVHFGGVRVFRRAPAFADREGRGGPSFLVAAGRAAAAFEMDRGSLRPQEGHRSDFLRRHSEDRLAVRAGPGFAALEQEQPAAEQQRGEQGGCGRPVHGVGLRTFGSGASASRGPAPSTASPAFSSGPAGRFSGATTRRRFPRRGRTPARTPATPTRHSATVRRSW